jgi:D-glucosaminate-6-phosphate ammonia-lyase
MKTMNRVSRRELFRLAGALGAGSLYSARGASTEASVLPPAVPPGDPNVYAAIGVRPMINCRGTFTIIGGSTELPEVRAAKSAANQQYVQLDELMDASASPS